MSKFIQYPSHREPIIRFDAEACPTMITFINNKGEDFPMTTENLAMELITHSDTRPGFISLDEATHIISLLDKNNPLPADLTPDSFMKAWNSIILFDLPEDLWS